MRLWGRGDEFQEALGRRWRTWLERVDHDRSQATEQRQDATESSGRVVRAHWWLGCRCRAAGHGLTIVVLNMDAHMIGVKAMNVTKVMSV